MIYSRTLGEKETYYSEYLDEVVVDLLSATFGIPQTYSYEVIKIDPGYECRSDLISKDIYNDDMYQDLLLKINGPSNPFEVNEGQYIIVPTFDSVDDFRVRPSKLWSSSPNDSYKPKPKSKTEKRKPNEAVIGDKRFNIDPVSKIVIY